MPYNQRMQRKTGHPAPAELSTLGAARGLVALLAFMAFQLVFQLVLQTPCLAQQKNPATTERNVPTAVGLKPAPYADGTRGSTDKNLSMHDGDYEACGQECFYKKGNEHISFFVKYVDKKFEYLSNKSNPLEKRCEALGRFCESCTDDEEFNSCFKKYSYFYNFYLVKVRRSLRDNNETVSQLQCSKRDSNGVCLVAAPPVAPAAIPFTQNVAGAEKAAQLPYFIKSEELAKQNQRLMNVQDRGTDENLTNQQWMDKIKNDLKPDPADFVKFKKILRNPANPLDGYLEIAVSDPSGKPMLDDQAYQRALKEWETGFGVLLTETIGDRKVIDLIKEGAQDLKKNYDGDPKGPPSINRKIYDEARKEWIGEFNNLILGTTTTPSNPGSLQNSSGSTGSPYTSTKPINSSGGASGTSPQSSSDTKGKAVESGTGAPTQFSADGKEQIRVPSRSEENKKNPNSKKSFSVHYDPSSLTNSFDQDPGSTTNQINQLPGLDPSTQ